MNVPYLEVAGITLSLLYLWLELEQKTAMWWVGIFSALLYMAIFFSAKLYASMGLHLYYLAASAYGLAVWRFGSKKAEQPLRVTPVRRRQLAV
ncbi:MAG: nicotinamide mononucleotide transporter family protein, partial [Prevotellaceae bacterium]|nr:nicotinamide mononucleotide transporter family protein [Prevotellaceae bacterium]